MAAIKERAERWIFTKKQLENTPSRKCNIDAEKELSYRQQAANLVQDMGQRLQVTQLCINTAIVYMHRFYMFHSFTKFHRNSIAPACLFLAAKVEEQPRKLEHVVGVAHRCLNRDAPPLTPDSEKYLEKAQELVIDENILLQTLGFDITVDHPHTHVVKTCQLVRASKDLAQTSYFLATNSLHLSMMCLTVKPTVVACVAIHLACKWSSWELPRSSEGKDWWWYVEKSVTKEMLEDLTAEFLNIIERCPTRLKGKIMTWKSGKREDVYGEQALEQFKDCSSPTPSTSRPSPRPDVKPSPHANIPVKPSPLAKEAKSLAIIKDVKIRSPGHSASDSSYKERKERGRQQQLLRKPNGSGAGDPKTNIRPTPDRPDHQHRQPDNRHRKLTTDDRHLPRADLSGHERSRSVDVTSKRPGDIRRPEMRPDGSRPHPRPEDRHGRPEERHNIRPDDRHGRPEERVRHDDQKRSDRPSHDRPRPELKRPLEAKHEEGIRVREHPKMPKLDNLKPTLPLRPEKKEDPAKEETREEQAKADLSSAFSALFGDSTSPSDSLDNFLPALEQELKSTESLSMNMDTPPGEDYGVDSSILDLMATPPAKIMEKPDFEKREEARKEEQRLEEARLREEMRKEEAKKEEMKREEQRREREEAERRERYEREKRDRERKEREERERREREERKKEARPTETSKDSRYITDARSKLTPEEIKKLEEEPSPYKKEKLYPPKERKEARPQPKLISFPPREVTKEFKPTSSTGALPAQTVEKPREVKKEHKHPTFLGSQPSFTRTEVKKEDSKSQTLPLPETRPQDHTDPVLQTLSHPEQNPPLKVRIPKPHSSKHSSSSQSPQPDVEDPAPLKLKINSSAGTVEPLKLKISLGKDREHHKEKKKHRKDEERHRHKHKSKSKTHDHDREHKSRKRAHSPGVGEASETKIRKHSESNGGALLSPHMQPVVELQKMSDAQIRRTSTSKSPSTSSPLKRPHQQ